MKYDYLIIGCGFAGAVIAERIVSQLNKKVLIIDKRNHIGGNAYDEIDNNGILIHKYGPHIFHTNSNKVFNYLSKFTDWVPYEHKVLARLNGNLYPIPINRITINKLYGLNLTTDQEVKNYYDKVRENRYPIKNSEDIIVNQVGIDLFEKFFKYYTLKQWNREPKDLAPSVCGRIPTRFNDDCRYFDDKFQYMPKDGYTKIFKKMLSDKNIHIELNLNYQDIKDLIVPKAKTIYTGPIDEFFNFEFGKLEYRSLRFEYETIDQEYALEAAQINCVDMSVPYTRMVEHKRLSFSKSSKTVVSKEYSIKDGEPYYPIPDQKNRELYFKYKKEAEKLENFIFCGRLAEYQYYNMDQVIANALTIFEKKIATNI